MSAHADREVLGGVVVVTGDGARDRARGVVGTRGLDDLARYFRQETKQGCSIQGTGPVNGTIEGYQDGGTLGYGTCHIKPTFVWWWVVRYCTPVWGGGTVPPVWGYRGGGTGWWVGGNHVGWLVCWCWCTHVGTPQGLVTHVGTLQGGVRYPGKTKVWGWGYTTLGVWLPHIR